MRTHVYFLFEILFFFRKVSGICYKLGPTEPRSENKDVCLRGYEYFSFKSPQLEKCEVQCLSNKICKSVNFHKTKKICALNNESEHTVGRNSFQTCPGAIHVDVMEMEGMQGYLGKCVNHTCPTETVCVPAPTGTKPRYSCLKQDNCTNAKFCPAPSTAYICKQCSDKDKEQCCTLNDTDCGTANIGECYCKFGEDPSRIADHVECGIQSCKPGYVCNILKNTCEIKVTSKMGVNGHYTLTFAEAARRCTDYGLTIATPAQLLEAWRQGMEMCSCGWLSDGSSGIILQSESPLCTIYPYNDGIMTAPCAFRTYQNVWCSI